MANGIRVYENWCQAIHEQAEESPMKAKDLAFRILDYGATGVMNFDGLSGTDRDWLASVQRGMEKTDEKANRSPGRPKLDLEEDVQRLLDSGVTKGTEIAAALHVSKDKIYTVEAWRAFQASKKKPKNSDKVAEKFQYDF